MKINCNERCDHLNKLLDRKLHSDFLEALREWICTFKNRDRFDLDFDSVLHAEKYDHIEELLRSYCADYYQMFAADKESFKSNPHLPVDLSRYHEWTQNIFEINGYDFWFNL